MLKNVISNCMLRANRCGQHKRDLVLADGVAGAISHTGFRPAISQRLKTERALIEMRRLLGVAHIKLDMIRPFERKKIFLHLRGPFGFWSSNRGWHNDLLNLSRRA